MIEVTHAFPNCAVAIGERTTVILVHSHPRRVCEVEFVREDGTTKALFAAEPADVRLVWRAPR